MNSPNGLAPAGRDSVMVMKTDPVAVPRVQKPGELEGATSPATTAEPAAAPESPISQERTKRDATAAAPAGAPAASSKRPRYDGRAFSDLTIADLERIVRENTDLKRQLASREEELAKVRETLQGKDAVAKQVKALEADLEKRQKETERLKSTVRDQDEDVNVQAERLKRSLRQQLSSQMLFHTCFRNTLQGQGREIVAFAANVTPEVLKAIGGEHGTKTKRTYSFFESAPAKTVAIGIRLVLARDMTFRYFKSSCELRVDAVYRIQAEGGKSQKDGKSQNPKKKQPKKAAKQKAAKASAEAEDEDEEDEAEAEDEEPDEGEDDGAEECEGEPEPEGAEAPAPSAE